MHALWGLASLAVLFACGLAPAVATNYTADGPCGSQELKQLTLLPASTGCKMLECVPLLVVTRPDPSMAGVGGCPKGPYPVVFFFSGFSSRAMFYSFTAARIASYGYVVVQYDLQAIIVPDTQEMKYLAPLKAAVARHSQLAGVVNFKQQAVAGHSRGGKLAALHYAQDPSTYKTAVLVDPVDNTIFSPESADYPSAVKALAALQPKLKGVVFGAGVQSMCNPLDANFAKFYNQTGPGSWLEVAPGAAHASYLSVVRGIVDGVPLFCGSATLGGQVVQDYTAATAAAWLDSVFRDTSMNADFQAWIKQSKDVEFSVKA